MRKSKITVAEIIDEQKKPSRAVMSGLYWLIPDDFLDTLKSYGDGLNHRITPVYDIDGRAVVNCDIVEDRETYYKPYMERGFNIDKMSSLDILENVVFPEPIRDTNTTQEVPVELPSLPRRPVP